MKNTKKMDALMTVKEFANNFGFEFYNKGENRYGITDPTNTVNFVIMEKTDWTTINEGYIDITLEVSACIATMGCFVDGDKLKEQAHAIENAGKLLNTLKIQSEYFHYLTYTKTL